MIRICGCGARLARRARLSASHHGSCQGALAPFAQLQASLPGTWPLDAFAGRALPAPACPSPGKAPPAAALVPQRMMPGAAPARIASPRGSTVPAPRSGSHPERALRDERDSGTERSRFGDDRQVSSLYRRRPRSHKTRHAQATAPLKLGIRPAAAGRTRWAPACAHKRAGSGPLSGVNLT
jgi:hypothetical protein